MSDRLLWYVASRAEQSRCFRFLLNAILSWVIPFNSPHGFKVCSLSKGRVTVKLPNKRVNRNHLNSIHACGLAALCEFTAGLAVMTFLEPSKYRIVLKSLNMDYQYRAKGDVQCPFEINLTDFQQAVILKLQDEDVVFYETSSSAFDTDGNLVCTATALWQIKSWSKVKSS